MYNVVLSVTMFIFYHTIILDEVFHLICLTVPQLFYFKFIHDHLISSENNLLVSI